MSVGIKGKFIDSEMTTDQELDSGLALKEDKSTKNQPNGYAGLDAQGKVLSSQLPEIFGTSDIIDGGSPSSSYLTENLDGGDP